MELSKLSKNTYHKCLKELHNAQYIIYYPAPSKFQVVRISIIKLCKDEGQSNKFTQLELFGSDEENISLKMNTGSVSNLGHGSRKIATGTVSKLRHTIKQNNKNEKSVCNTPTQIFEKNKELNEKMNQLANVSILRLQEVEEFFKENNYPLTEAHKFFYYNQGKNWMLTNKLPIFDWQALAHKWMLNITSPKANSQLGTISSRKESIAPAEQFQIIQQLYDQYLQGQKINKFILPEFCDYLQLEVTPEINQEAIQRRINQLSGSNETSVHNLWKAYMAYNQNDPHLISDQDNLTTLAKRLTVSKYFHQLKAEKKLIIPKHQ